MVLETVGQNLRAARLRRGDEIAAVSQALKIRKDHLNAVEQDRLEDLPGKTYAIGFVRSYARYLGLDSEQMVERFKQEIAGRAEEQSPMLPTTLHHDERKLPQGWRIIAGVVILLLGYGIWHILTANREVSQAVPPPPVLVAAVPKPKPTPPPSPISPPVVNSPATDTVAPPKPAPASDTSGPSAVPSPAIGTGPGPAVPAVMAAATGQAYGAQNKNARVIIRSRGTAHIEVHGRDGMVYINRTLNPGDYYNVPNIVGLSLTTTNAGAVEVDLDGLAMGHAGGDLQPVGNISLDPQAIVDRFNRHSG